MRKIFVCFIAAIAAAFLWALIFTSDTFAADASWNTKTAISYEDNTYLGPITEADNISLGLPKDTKAYTYTDPTVINSSSTDPQKIHIIYFTSDVDINTATSAKYKTYLYNGPGDFTNPSSPISIAINQQSSAPDPGTSSCVVDGGLGWIICPITNFIANGMDHIFGILSNFLAVRPVGTNSDSALFRAWTYMRSFANVAFVIAFLIIIYSQLTNLGVSNYGIKKLLPRLIIAAILVNLSYYVCAIAVDISNILGHSLQDVFINMRNSLVGSEGNNWDTISFSSVSSFILSGGTLAAAGTIGLGLTLMNYGIAGSLFLLLPALMAGLVAVLVALLIMATRQALVTILIILAPLAFVAYLLPNTEKWYEKWQKTFMTMLILFPAFSIVFGGSQLAAAAIIQNADSINLIILGMIIQVVPLFVTPLLINMSGSIIGKVAGIVNNPNKGLIDRTRKFTDDRAQNIMAKRLGAKAKDGEILKRGAQYIDHRRRKREGLRSARTSMTDARWANSIDYSNIDQVSRKATDSKSLGEGHSELRYNTQKTVTGSHIQNLDMQLRGNKHQLDNVNTKTENIFKTSPAYESLHESSYKLENEKGKIEQTLERNLRNRVRSTPDMLKNEMEVHVLTDEANLSKAHLDKVYEDLKAGAMDSGNMAGLSYRAKITARDVAISSIANVMAKKQQQRIVSESLSANVDMINGQLVTDFAGSVGGTVENGAKRVHANATSAVTRATMEEIKEIKDASIDIPAGAAGLAEMVKRIKDAVHEKDSVTVRAYIDMLSVAGNPGIDALRTVLEDVDLGLRTPSGQVTEQLQNVKDFINVSSTINIAAEDIAAWSRTTRSISDVSQDPDTWNNLSAIGIADMKASSQLAAIRSGGVSKKIAKELLENETLSSKIRPNVIKALEKLL